MSKVSRDSDIQLATAREVIDGCDIALQANGPTPLLKRERNFSDRWKPLANE
jgi:hypothetical protein